MVNHAEALIMSGWFILDTFLSVEHESVLQNYSFKKKENLLFKL